MLLEQFLKLLDILELLGLHITYHARVSANLPGCRRWRCIDRTATRRQAADSIRESCHDRDSDTPAFFRCAGILLFCVDLCGHGRVPFQKRHRADPATLAHKKTDVAKHLKVFRHIGLLFNGPPDLQVALYLVIRAFAKERLFFPSSGNSVFYSMAVGDTSGWEQIIIHSLTSGASRGLLHASISHATTTKALSSGKLIAVFGDKSITPCPATTAPRSIGRDSFQSAATERLRPPDLANLEMLWRQRARQTMIHVPQVRDQYHDRGDLCAIIRWRTNVDKAKAQGQQRQAREHLPIRDR